MHRISIKRSDRIRKRIIKWFIAVLGFVLHRVEGAIGEGRGPKAMASNGYRKSNQTMDFDI
jgi:hypothetical protein